MKMTLKLIFSIVIASLFITGCARTSSMQTFDNSQYFQKRMSTNKIARAIRDGANRKGWNARKIRNGLIVASILVRNKYFVAVNINYNAYGYKIRYKNSRNMKYNPADNSIHPSYNKWVRLLQDNINYELSNIGMSNASSNEPVAMPVRSKKKRVYKKRNVNSYPKVDNFQIGKTTKKDIVAKYGNPNGVSVSASGIETLTYNRRHITGKGFIPYYMGSDRFRTYKKFFKFKNGVLTDYSTDENHY